MSEIGDGTERKDIEWLVETLVARGRYWRYKALLWIFNLLFIAAGPSVNFYGNMSIYYAAYLLWGIALIVCGVVAIDMIGDCVVSKRAALITVCPYSMRHLRVILGWTFDRHFLHLFAIPLPLLILGFGYLYPGALCFLTLPAALAYWLVLARIRLIRDFAWAAYLLTGATGAYLLSGLFVTLNLAVVAAVVFATIWLMRPLSFFALPLIGVYYFWARWIGGFTDRFLEKQLTRLFGFEGQTGVTFLYAGNLEHPNDENVANTPQTE